jgi:hypothetical protein
VLAGGLAARLLATGRLSSRNPRVEARSLTQPTGASCGAAAGAASQAASGLVAERTKNASCPGVSEPSREA